MPDPYTSPNGSFSLAPNCTVVYAGKASGLILRVGTGRCGEEAEVAAIVTPERWAAFLVWLRNETTVKVAKAPDLPPRSFQDRLAKALAVRGRQTELAAKLGVTSMALSRYRRGLAVPILPIARKMAALLGWDWPTVMQELVEARMQQAGKEREKKVKAEGTV